MVRVRNSGTCAICEFVMKQLESLLEDQSTEVGYVLLNLSNMVIKFYYMLSACWCSAFDSGVTLIHSIYLFFYFFFLGGGDSSCGEGVHISALISGWRV